MKLLILVVIISVLVVGCNPPHIDNCITDLNKIDRAILDAPENISKAEILQIIHETKANVCQPFDPKLPVFYRPLSTGDHTYDSDNWEVLMKRINDNT